MKYLLLITILFSGCYTANKAKQQATKAMDKHPATVLPLFRDKFPCIATAVTTTTDSSAFTNFRDSANAIIQFYEELINNIQPEVIEKHDTIQDLAFCNSLIRSYERNEEKYKQREQAKDKQIADLKYKIDHMPPVVQKVVEKIKDSADIKILAIKNEDQKYLIEKLYEKNEKKASWITWLIIAVFVLAAGNVLRFKKII